MEKILIGDSTLELVQGNITAQDTEAVVNAANSRLAPGGGVAGAIHRAAGNELWQECKALGGCATGEAKITKGYKLPNKYVIHTVGPIYSGKRDDALMLKSCYLNCLKLAQTNKIRSIAFPAISTGAFGYPLPEAAGIALSTIIEYLKQEKRAIDVVRLVLYDKASLVMHLKTLNEIR